MNSNIIEWRSLIIHNKSSSLKRFRRVEVEEHPLSITTNHVERIPRRILGSQPGTGRASPVATPSIILQPLSDALEGLDPLTQFSQELDPLSQMVVESSNVDSVIEEPLACRRNKQASFYDIKPWNTRRNSILAKYTTSEKLSIITSFLSDGEKVVVKTHGPPVDKVQHRLEQLDYFEEGSQKKFNLSQTEYVGRIEQLNKELVNAWHAEQRVKALKIAIQCAKVLADTDVLLFYPSKFVLITDILDIFGQLVYERLRTKADYCKPGSKVSTALPEDFTSDMVPESAKETCRNWFYKIASIRELVPRLYVEMAILKSYSFLTSSEFSAALMRLTRMIRGIGNPLVAVYARCYLCRVGITVTSSTTDTHYLKENFYDFLETYDQVFGRYLLEDLKIQKMSKSTYLNLFSPALDYILQLLTYGASENLLSELLNKCRKLPNNIVLIHAIMNAFKPQYIVPRSLEFLELIENCENDFPSYMLIRTLGLCVCICPPLSEHRRDIVNMIWQLIRKLKNPEQYIMCVEVWIQFAVQYFSSKEVNVILGDIVKHLAPERAYEEYYPQMKRFVEKITWHIQDFESLLSMDNFFPLIDLFQQENVKIEVCKDILCASSVIQQTSDPVITNSLLFLCGILHDSINALTVEDEYRQISELICSIIKKVNYGRDFEQQLTFYVEARGAFSNLDLVLAQLVQCVNTLAINTHRVVRGHHTVKTASFVRACAAYCFITIPSITSICTRLELYLLSGKVALYNNCLAQADASFKAALAIIPDLVNSEETQFVESFLVSYARNFLSTLLVVPDNPDRGVLSLTRGLLNSLQKFEWNVHNYSLAYLYLNVLDMLSAMAQETYPYHIYRVESNDALYGADPKFTAEIDKMCTVILRELLSQIKQMKASRQQATISLELMVRLSTVADLHNAEIQGLVINLWNISRQHGYIDKKHMVRTQNYIKEKTKIINNKQLNQLVDKLTIA